MRIFLFSLAALLGSVHPTWSDTLWDKAVRHFTDPRPIPQELVLEEKFIKKEGKIEHISVINANLFRGSNNQILFVARSGTSNGEKIPHDDLQKMTEVLAEKDLKSVVFTDDPQARVQWRSEQGVRVIGDHSCQRFSFTSEIEGHKAEGAAWLTIDSGLPLEVEWRFLDVPFKDEDSTINTYKQMDYYAISAGGECPLVQSEIVISLKYSLFFIPFEGELQRRTTFSKHSKRQELPDVIMATN